MSIDLRFNFRKVGICLVVLKDFVKFFFSVEGSNDVSFVYGVIVLVE